LIVRLFYFFVCTMLDSIRLASKYFALTYVMYFFSFSFLIDRFCGLRFHMVFHFDRFVRLFFFLGCDVCMQESVVKNGSVVAMMKEWQLVASDHTLASDPSGTQATHIHTLAHPSFGCFGNYFF